MTMEDTTEKLVLPLDILYPLPLVSARDTPTPTHTPKCTLWSQHNPTPFLASKSTVHEHVHVSICLFENNNKQQLATR